MSDLLFAKIYYDIVYCLGCAKQLMEFNSEAITEACIKIAVHRKVGKIWHTKFCTQLAAAKS